jgi:hypothetical protein
MVQSSKATVPREIKADLPYDSAIPLVGIYPKEVKAGSLTDVHSSIVHNTQNGDTIQEL